MGCTYCHGGVDPAADKASAHVGVNADPAQDPTATCATCHAEVVTSFTSSMHWLLSGERTMIEARSGMDLETDPALSAGFEQSCNGCHAGCGDCHVSRPDSVGKGFIKGHAFNKTPDLVNQCTACHGSRIGEEFRGTHRDEISGYTGDTHYLDGHRCEFCHGATEIHGAAADHRYAVAEMPRCEDCHTAIDTANLYHMMHLGDLSCQVCHAQDYKNCASCHVPDGLDDESSLGFKIGRNPLPEERDARFVTLRHIPIAPDTFAGWGFQGDLTNYDSLPSWKYTSPHNIARWTARTTPAEGAACGDACHDSPATLDGWFLRQIDLDQHPAEATANQAYIVPDTPAHEWGD